MPDQANNDPVDHPEVQHVLDAAKGIKRAEKKSKEIHVLIPDLISVKRSPYTDDMMEK